MQDEYEQELHEVDFLASEIRHAQYTQREHESQRNAAEDEEQMQLALALSLSQEQTMSRNNDINAKQTLLQEWKSEVQDARDILGEDDSAQTLTGSSTTIAYCKEVLKLNSMFDGNAIPVDVQKQQRVVEKLRDNLETELEPFPLTQCCGIYSIVSENLFLQRFHHLFHQTDILHDCSFK